MLHAGLAAVLGVVFAASAGAKVADIDGFRRSLPATLGITGASARLLAPAVAVVEVVLVLGAVVGLWWTPVAVLGFAASAALLTVFTAAITAMVRRGVTEPCRCFGPRAAPPGPIDLLRNAVLVLVALGGLVVVTAGGRADGGELVGTVIALGAGAAGAALLIHLDDLGWLFGPVRSGVE